MIGSGRPDATGQPRLLIEIAPEILLPPPGDYLGSALTDDRTSVVAARVVVPVRASGGHQHLELFAQEPLPQRSPFAQVSRAVSSAPVSPEGRIWPRPGQLHDRCALAGQS